MSRWQTASLVVGNKPQVEDRARIFHVGDACILIVSDGAGGVPGGAEAAQIVIDAITEEAIAPYDLDDPNTWLRLMAEIDEQIMDDPEVGETTAVIAAVTPNGITGVSAGDSGAWLIGTHHYDDLTERQYVKGRLGNGMAMPVSFQSPLGQNTLLLASDGLFNYCAGNKIRAFVRNSNLDQIIKQLTDAVRLPSGELWDDVSVVLCRASGTMLV